MGWLGRLRMIHLMLPWWMSLKGKCRQGVWLIPVILKKNSPWLHTKWTEKWSWHSGEIKGYPPPTSMEKCHNHHTWWCQCFLKMRECTSQLFKTLHITQMLHNLEVIHSSWRTLLSLRWPSINYFPHVVPLQSILVPRETCYQFSVYVILPKSINSKLMASITSIN